MFSYREGSFTIFEVECKITHKTEHGHPEGRFIAEKEHDNWFVGNFYWHRPNNEKAKDDKSDTWQKTGFQAFSNIKNAIDTLKWCKAQKEWKFTDGYGSPSHKYKCDFRIVKKEISHRTKVLELDDILEHL